MRLLDRIALNRLVSIITGFILAIVKILALKTSEEEDIDEPKPPKRRVPWLRRKNKS